MSSSALPVCSYCGNGHTGTCPKIKSIEYRENGTVRRVEFHDPVVRDSDERGLVDVGSGPSGNGGSASAVDQDLAWELDTFQARASAWVDANFPGKVELDAGLVAAEEAAEASAAMSRLLVKTRQQIRGDENLDQKVRDEFADCLIAFADYCTARGWSLGDVVEERASEVFARAWTRTFGVNRG